MLNKKKLRPLWVCLHWLMALLVFVTFGIGLLSLANKPNDNEKLIPLGLHIILGIAILIIVSIRYALRLLVFSPPKRTAETARLFAKKLPFLDQLSVYVHPLFYLFSALMALLGIAISIPTQLFSIIFTHSGAALPTSFYVYPARIWHGSLSLILMLLIFQHVLTAIFHQFIKGENFLGRMWFIKK